MKTIIFINQKGGVGKTVSTLSTGAALQRKGYRVLLVDIDPQGDLSTAAGVEPDEADATIYEVLKGEARITDAIITAPGGYDVAPTDIRQSGAEIELAPIAGRDFLLKEALEEVQDHYDFALIDSPRSLSIITIMGLTAADGVIVTLKTDYLALKAIAQLQNTVEIVRRRLNPKLDYTGVLLTFNKNTNLTKKVAEYAEEGFPGKVFNTRINVDVALAEAPGAGRDIFAYKPKSKGAAQYEELTEEILNRIGYQ